MIYEFAISPSLCTDYQNLRLFLETFGGENGRLFSDIPRRQWERLARREIKQSENGQIEKKRLVAGIERLIRKAIYRRNKTPEINSGIWLDHAIAAHEDRPFKAILTNCYEGEEACILINDHRLIEHTLWQSPLDRIIPRSANEMVASIVPMLDCSRELILIDRNFHPEYFRWKPFIVELSKYLSKRSFTPSINKIDFHIGDKLSSDHLTTLWNKNIIKEIPEGIKFNFFIWPWEQLHDRYVLTDIGGIEFGIGLDVFDGSGPENVKVSRISENTRLFWWKACKQKSPSFTIPVNPISN